MQDWKTPCTGTLISDSLTNRQMDVMVQDSCPDGGWCTEDPYHLDISQGTILYLGGQDLLNSWNNR